MHIQEVVRDFVSKRNNVSLVKMFDRLFIKKVFQSEELMKKELNEYLILGKLGITAQIVDYGEQNGDSYIIMEYIDGQTLYDIIMEDKLAEEKLSAIANGVKNAIKLTIGCGRVISDVNYRNFIVSDDKIYIVDLEELEKLVDDNAAATDNIIEKLAAFGEKYTDRKSDNYEIFKKLLLE